MTKAFIDQLADICEETANVLLAGLVPTAHDAVPAPLWERDRKAIEAELGSAIAHQWLHDCVSTYLLEAAYELLAIGSLLRTRKFHAAMDPLVRAIIERTGVVNWILSEEATHRQRALRSSIAYIVSLNPYLKTLKGIKAKSEHQQHLIEQQRIIEESIVGWFGEPERPIDVDTSEPTTDRAKWIIEGESYPGFNKLAKLSLERSNLTKSMASAMYDAWSGFTHPNVFFASEHIVSVEGKLTLSYSEEDLERAVRFAVGTFGEAVKRWACYFEAEQDSAVARVDALSDKLDEISVLSV